MEYDYIIIGAGVIGSSAAYHLKRMVPKANILLIDRNRRVGAGNTAKSAALYRNIFSSGTARTLAKSSIRYYETLGNKVSLKPIGYLWLFSKKQWSDYQAALKEIEPKKNNFEILDQADISALLNMNQKGGGAFQEVYAALYGHSCGSLSAMMLAHHYASEFEKMGGEIALERQIISFDLSGQDCLYAPWCDITIQRLRDQNGTVYRGSHIVVAAGAWTQELLLSIGIAPGIFPKKRQLFGVKIKESTQIIRNRHSSRIPVIILPTANVYIKPILEKQLIVVGCADELGQPFQMSNPEPDIHYFYRAIEPVLLHYFPNLRDYELALKWAGYYAYYWPDKNPVIETVSNLTWVGGTSGSGIMKADAIGRITAAQVQGLDKAELFDGTSFRVSRLSLFFREVERERFII